LNAFSPSKRSFPSLAAFPLLSLPSPAIDGGRSPDRVVKGVLDLGTKKRADGVHERQGRRGTPHADTTKKVEW